MPPSAPDDPTAYRGARYRMVHRPGGPGLVEVDGRPAPWLQSPAWAFGPVGPGLNGPYFGDQQIFDGRRRMVWFFRLVEPPAPVYDPNPPPEPPLSTTAPPPRPASTRAAPAAPAAPAWAAPVPPPPFEEVVRPPDPPRAILDVLVVPAGAPQGSGVEYGCGPDTVIIVGDDAWRFDRTTGRIEPTDAGAATCPDDYD